MMHPAAGAVAVAGDALMDVRAAARANIILGLAMVAIARFAATINPGDFPSQLQTIQQAAAAAAPGAQPHRCVATGAEALDLREEAPQLVLMGVVQAVFAAAANVAVEGSLDPVLCRLLGAPAHIFGVVNAYSLCYVVRRAAVVAIGHCAGKYLAYLVIGYVLLAMSYALLLGVSLAVTFC